MSYLMAPTSVIHQSLSLVVAVLVCIASVASGQSTTKPSTSIATVMSPYFGHTAGKVVDEQGNPVAGARVFCRSWPTGDPVGGYGRTTTGEDGTFSFCEPGVTYDDYVTVAHPDFAYGENDVSQKDAFRKSLLVTMSKGVSVKGRFVDSEDRGIPGMEVFVNFPNFYTQADRFVHAFAKTDENGDFTILNAPDKPQLYLSARKFGEVAQYISWYSATAEMPQKPVLPEGYINLVGTNDERDDFTRKLPGRFRLAINAVDAESGEAVALNTIGIHHDYNPFHAGDGDFQRVPTESASRVVVSNLGYMPYNVTCAAAPDSQYLQGIVSGSFDKEFEGIEATRTIRLEKGIPVQGTVVDKLTGKPIPRARIQYVADSSQKALLRSKEVNLAISAATDKDGKFDILVPSGPGLLEVSREVPGYFSVDPQSRRPVSLSIEPKPGKTPTKIEFRLERAPWVHGSAIDPDGNPVRGASWVATESEYFDMRFGGRADENSNFVINSLYQHPANSPDSSKRVYCWDLERDLRGWALTKRGDAESGKRLDIRLRPAHSLQGRIVDKVSAAGIPDFVVTIRMGAFTWTTKSDDQGNFKVTGLFPGLSYRLKADHAVFRSSETEFKTSDDAETVSLEPIVCNTAESKFFQVVDVTKMPDDMALEQLVKYIREQLQQAPLELEAKPYDPIIAFRYKLSRAINEQVSLLAARHPDSDFECKVYLMTLDAICTRQKAGMNSVPLAGEWTDHARFALIRNIDREGMFDEYKKRSVAWRMQGTIYPMTILKHSKKPEILIWAHELVFRENLSNLRFLYFNPETKKTDEFERMLKSVKRLYLAGVTESGEVSPGTPAGTVLRDKFQAMLTQTQNDLERQIEFLRTPNPIQQQTDYDPARVERFSAFIKELAAENK